MSLTMTETKRKAKPATTTTKKNAEPADAMQVAAYKLMFESRVLDEKMLIMLRQGKSYFHIGCMGHEAVQVACGMVMKSGTDWLFPYYRDQALCMALGQTGYE